MPDRDKQNPKDSPQVNPQQANVPPIETPQIQPSALAANTKISDLTVADLSNIIAAQAAREVASILGNRNPAGVHVNSGPPGFVNGGGHANFDPASRFNLGDVGRAGVHVNSGPPGFVNGGGHANFDPASRFNLGDVGRAGSHVNSGPPGFVNGGGHANFDPKSRIDNTLVNVTLPDGGKVAIPATGPVDMTIRGFRVKR